MCEIDIAGGAMKDSMLGMGYKNVVVEDGRRNERERCVLKAG